jgi:predicted O-methyltransferase YrrM
MLNDIVINDRKSIIEFGSGLSTIMIGRLIKKNGLDTRVLPVEHDEEWMKALAGILKNENTGDAVTLLHARLRACELQIRRAGHPAILEARIWF